MKCANPKAEFKASFGKLAKKYGVKSPNFELILFKDELLPNLISSVGTHNYDDFNIRAISLIAMAERQKNKKRGV